MAYPFLPVNPCCTDVVLNTPCGCSSVMTNSGCNNNDPCSTHLTASSTIVYDGVALPCIVAEPCDTLNVILQKIDEIICNLQTQINYLTNQVTNITNQVININGDIINIYNTLDGCCSATTTSTSTTVRPCENFSLDNTGDDPVAIIITDCTTQEQEAIVLMPGDTNICVITNSPLTVPGTVVVTPNGPCVPLTTTTTSSSTTSTTSTSSTTTTTTTAILCECLTFSNTDSVAHSITYNNCAGEEMDEFVINAYATIQVCGCCGLATNELVTITVGANCIDEQCPVPTTTTTTTAAPLCNCFDTDITISLSTLNSTDNTQVTVLYDDCFGVKYINTYDKPGVYSLGCVNDSVGIIVTGLIKGDSQILDVPIETGVPCCDVVPTTTTTTTTIPPTTTTTTTQGPLRYYYNATFYNCGNCTTPSSAGSFNNSQPLTANRYYINSSGTIIYINSFNSVTPGISFNNILDSSQQVTCGGIVCPTTTTTTTLLPNVVIGEQRWLVSNLDVTTYRDGTPIPQVTDPTAWANLTTGAWCYYNNDPANGAIYGKLYNWYAVNDPRGLAPQGWHIPTDAEWSTLVAFLGGDNVAGGKMKSTGTSLWQSPNTNATNSSDFTGFPGGYRNDNAEFQKLTNNGYWWSSTQSETVSTKAFSRNINYDNGQANGNAFPNAKKNGFSVRCIKD